MEYCLTFEEEVEGSSTHILTSVNSIDADCLECTTPDPTPTPEIFSVYERCGGVACVENDITYGEQTNPNDIVNNWTRFSYFARNVFPGTNVETGLQPDGTIITNDNNYWFYTGGTINNSSRYLGVHNLPMTEGENVGPTSPPLYGAIGVGGAAGADDGRFYFNSYINKFVVWYNVGQPGWAWTTFNPTVNEGQALGNPTGSQILTTNTNWNVVPLTTNKYTVEGSSNTVVDAITKITNAGGTPNMIQCSQNSGLINGFYSTCGFSDYTHEVTIGSTANDNDYIGLVLSTIKDDEGIYGPSGSTQSLLLTFNSTQNPGNETSKVNITYNQSNDTLAFTDGLGNFSTDVWETLNSPFSNTGNSGENYDRKGDVRVKVIKTGTTITVYTTEMMGNQCSFGNICVPVGNSNPYTLLVSLDLNDINTWTDAPSYATGNELIKFADQGKIGYHTASQPQTQFYDIVFSGSQLTNTDTLYGLNVVNPGVNNVSTFNEVPGCWKYIEDITGYVGPSYSLSLDTGYPNCTQCPSDDGPLPSLTPTSTPTPTPTITPTCSSVVPPTPTPTPTVTPSSGPSGNINGFISGGLLVCSDYCSIQYSLSTSTTWDGLPQAPTFIYGLEDFPGNQDLPWYFAFDTLPNVSTGQGNDNTYRIALVEKDAVTGVFGRVGLGNIFAGGCDQFGNCYAE